MKNLSREEMKKVMGGSLIIGTHWECTVQDPGDTPHQVNSYCSVANPETYCFYTTNCFAIGDCSSFSGCINW